MATKKRPTRFRQGRRQGKVDSKKVFQGAAKAGLKDKDRFTKFSADDIYNINKSSMKDAVVLFGGGCTGEIISDKGLLLTNHHCGFSQIQSHSTLEKNYLKICSKNF